MSNQRTGSKLHWWQRKEIIIAFAIIGTLVLIAVLIFAVHTYHLDLATTTTTEVTKSPQEKMATTETGKTILDWLQLLGVIAIPIVVGFGTIFFTSALFLKDDKKKDGAGAVVFSEGVPTPRA